MLNNHVELPARVITPFCSRKNRDRFLRLIARWKLPLELLSLFAIEAKTAKELLELDREFGGFFPQAIVWIDPSRRAVACVTGMRDSRSRGYAIQFAYVREDKRRIGIGRLCLEAAAKTYRVRIVSDLSDPVADAWLRACGWKVCHIERVESQAIWHNGAEEEK